MKRPAPPKKTAAKKRAVAETPAPLDPAFGKVAAAFARDRDVACEPGWGAGNTVLKVKGKIFAMTVRGEFVAKLPKARCDELVAGRHAVYFDPRKNGRLMKEWVVVAEGAADWLALAREAHAFVKSK